MFYYNNVKFSYIFFNFIIKAKMKKHICFMMSFFIFFFCIYTATAFDDFTLFHSAAAIFIFSLPLVISG